MRKPSAAALFCVLLVAAPGALAQDYLWYDVLFSVEGWPKSTRADGKLAANYFSLVAQGPQASAKSNVRNLELSLPLGDPAALFMKAALQGDSLKTILLEAFVHGVAKQPSPAPFAVRLTDVRVNSVQLNMGGVAQVTLQATRVEVFTAHQSQTGAMQPGLRFFWDIKTGTGG
jgi:hypothetical protein